VQFKYVLAMVAMLVFMAASWALESKIPSMTPAPEVHASEPDHMPHATPDSRYYKSLPKKFSIPTDDVGRLILHEYGALFVAREGAVPPTTVRFRDEEEVQAFQSSVSMGAGSLAGSRVELQKPAFKALLEATEDARKDGLTIGPRGDDSSRRRFEQTVSLWASRVVPGMKHWVAARRVASKEAARILALSPFEQVPEILALEKQGIFFAKSLDKSIIYSVAPPGTSQHLSMLALDVKEFENAQVRAILARHGWYQTVTSDLPHFTYLGVKEAELPKLGLKPLRNANRTFWVPDID
jgi:hypothetical protein